MSHLRRLLLRLLNFLRPEPAERELSRELEAHLSLLEDEFLRRGLTPEDARHAAMRASGGAEQIKEWHRDARSFPWLEDTWRDLGYAMRGLRKDPGFTAVAITTLAIGIGVNATVFAVTNAVLFK